MVEVEYGNGRYASPTEAIVDAVAAASRTDPADLPPLYDVVDPDSVNRLFSNADEAEKLLVFGFGGWSVFVRDDGRIRVCDPESGARSPVFD